MPMNLEYREGGDRTFNTVDMNTNQNLYSFHFTFSEASGSMYVSRGDGSQIGSAKFHSLSSKQDMMIGNSVVRVKKEFASQTGLGFLQWRKDGGSCFSSKGNLILESGGSRIATFRLDKGPGYYKRQGGGIEIHTPGLTQAQMYEIVVIAVVELSRRKFITLTAIVSSAAA